MFNNINKLENSKSILLRFQTVDKIFIKEYDEQMELVSRYFIQFNIDFIRK